MKPHRTLYQGRRWPDLGGRQQRLVTVDGHELLPDESRRLLDYGQDRFNWGFSGEGPAQLALAILLDYLEDPGRALALHQAYQHDVIRHLGNAWRVVGIDIQAWLAAIGPVPAERRPAACGV